MNCLLTVDKPPTCAGEWLMPPGSNLSDFTDDDWERGRKAVEDVLVTFRDERISLPFRGNGLVIREADGTPSSQIRLGMEDALRIGVKAILDAPERQP